MILGPSHCVARCHSCHLPPLGCRWDLNQCIICNSGSKINMLATFSFSISSWTLLMWRLCWMFLSSCIRVCNKPSFFVCWQNYFSCFCDVLFECIKRNKPSQPKALPSFLVEPWCQQRHLLEPMYKSRSYDSHAEGHLSNLRYIYHLRYRLLWLGDCRQAHALNIAKWLHQLGAQCTHFTISNVYKVIYEKIFT